MIVALFAVSALVATWASYDYSAAASRLGLLATGLLLFFLTGLYLKQDSTHIARIGTLCLLSMVTISLYFAATHRWSGELTSDFSPLHSVGLWLETLRPMQLSVLPPLHPNTAAGAIALLLPLAWSGSAAGRYLSRMQASRVALQTRTVFLWIGLAIACLALLLTGSRGAWLGLIAAAAVVFPYLLLNCSRWHRATRVLPLALGLIVAIASVYLFVSVANAQFSTTEARYPVLSGRTDLWRQTLLLISDYRFTGSGLGGAAMIYSSYATMLHVVYLTHAHNLFLQIALEQGLPGLFTFGALCTGALWTLARLDGAHNRNERTLLRLAWAGSAASTVVLLVHGLLDSQMATSLLSPLLFLPLGVVYGLQRQSAASFREPFPFAETHVKISPAWAGGLAVIALILLFLLPSIRGYFYANLGAVAQQKAELSLYSWPEWPLQDAMRRDAAVDLSVPISYYEQALALAPGNATAHRRLGQIALSLGHYDEARAHLQVAHRQNPRSMATRQMLGEVYALEGNIDEAATLWQTVDNSLNQLETRLYWYEWLEAPRKAANLQQTLDSMLVD